MREPSRVVLTFWSVVVGLAALLLAVRLSGPKAPAGGPKTPPRRVAALAERLGELARRSRVKGPSVERALLLVWRPSERCGRYYGTAMITGWNALGGLVGGETRLAFSLEAHLQLATRNPARQALPAVVLSRHEPRSDLVGPGEPGQLLVRFDTGMVERPGVSRIAIDNFTGRRAAASAQAFNRAFDSLLGDSHCDLTVPEAQSLGLLESVLRARTCPPAGSGPCRPAVLTLALTAVEGRFRAEVRVQGESEATAFEIALELGPEGEPKALTLVGLGRATSSAEIARLSVHRPVAAGEPVAPASAEVVSPSGPGRQQSPEARVEITALIAGTGWEKVTLPWR